MEFSEGYLTYEEYKALGGTLDLMPFNILEFEARRKIDNKTQNRLKNIENIPQEVKLCEYELINRLYGYASQESGNVTSESTDGYSVSYVTVADLDKVVVSRNTEINDTIDTYLYGVIVNGEHLLYCGIK